MNYLKYNDIYTIPYKKLQTFSAKEEIILFEFIVDSVESAQNYFLQIKDNLNYNMEIFFQNKLSISFVLTNCYFENNLIILEGRK